MKQSDAAKILGIDGDLTPEIIKRAYREQCMKFHPDRNPAGLEMMKSINEAYETLKDFTGNISAGAQNYDQSLHDAIAFALNLGGVNVEVCGAWVWLSGDTKTHSQTLSKARFNDNRYWFAPKKKMWYFRPEDYKSHNRGTWSMDEIRDQHGSVEIRGEGRRKIANG